MLWVLLVVGCLSSARSHPLVGIPLSMHYDYQELVDFFNVLYSSEPFSFEWDFESRLNVLRGKLKVELWAPLELKPSGRVSYPDSQTKLCSMEVVSKKWIVIKNLKGQTLLTLYGCKMDLQYSVKSERGVDIGPKAIEVFGCERIVDGGGEWPTWGSEVPCVLSTALLGGAEQYLAHRYEDINFFSVNGVTNSTDFLEILGLVLLEA